jgi:hypothetical protein
VERLSITIPLHLRPKTQEWLFLPKAPNMQRKGMYAGTADFSGKCSKPALARGRQTYVFRHGQQLAASAAPNRVKRAR